MSFFHKYKNKHSEHSQCLEQDRLVQRCVNRCLRAQDRASLLLQAKSERLSLGIKKLVVIVFCLVSFSGCVYLVIKSVSDEHPLNVSIASIRIPKEVTQNRSRRMAPSNGLSKEEFEQIRKLGVYLDSLTNSNSGRRTYDSIMKYRAGLMDSLNIIENLYKSQSSNK